MAQENEVCDYTALLQASIRQTDLRRSCERYCVGVEHEKPERVEHRVSCIDGPGQFDFLKIFLGMALAAVAFAVWHTCRRTEEAYAPGDRWRLIVLSHICQVSLARQLRNVFRFGLTILTTKCI